jgi:hypothetical protein
VKKQKVEKRNERKGVFGELYELLKTLDAPANVVGQVDSVYQFCMDAAINRSLNRSCAEAAESGGVIA